MTVKKFIIYYLIACASFLISNSVPAGIVKINSPPSLEISKLTWIQLVDFINSGYNTVIIPSGGIEQNGPHMVLGKHNFIIEWTSLEIAKRVGNTLISPTVSFVPEGSIEQRTGNMKFPGTIGVSEEVYYGILDGIIRSLKLSGFKNICLIADHGGSLDVQQKLAERLSKEWGDDGVRVINISRYYDAGNAQVKYLQGLGFTSKDIGDHAGMLDTSELMFVYTNGVNINSLNPKDNLQNNYGHSGDPAKSSELIGKKLLDLKIKAAVDQINSEILH